MFQKNLESMCTLMSCNWVFKWTPTMSSEFDSIVPVFYKLHWILANFLYQLSLYLHLKHVSYRGIYSSSLCFFCLLSHYFWIEYFLIFIFMVFNGSLAIELTLVQHRFQFVGPPTCGLFSINIQFSPYLRVLNSQIQPTVDYALCL